MSSNPQVAMRPVDELRPYERNPLTHFPGQIAEVVRSIGAFGWRSPILLDREGWSAVARTARS